MVRHQRRASFRPLSHEQALSIDELVGVKERMVEAIRQDATARCPLCAALTAPPLQVGEAVHILSGPRCGASARVSRTGPIAGEVLLHLDGEPPDWEVRFKPGRDVAERLPGLGRPAWFPPLSLLDARPLHQETLECLAREGAHPDLPSYPTNFYWLVRSIWQARLPIEPRELKALLTHHGLSQEAAGRYAAIYRHGIRVLVVAVGRKPIKKKRVHPDWLRPGPGIS